jgi:glycine betaine catabolism B
VTSLAQDDKKNMNYIDNFLNKITMYRLVLYILICFLAVAAVLSLLKFLPFDPVAIIGSSLFLVAVCWITNTIFAKVFDAPTNLESVYITALILALIITPSISLHNLPFLFWAGVLAMSSKYIVAIKKKHLFNPVAIAVVLTSFGIGSSASWWVGTAWMLPFVLLGGFLIVRKIQRSDMVFAFLIVSLVTTFAFSVFRGSDIVSVAKEALLYSPLFFFAFIMLTEPLTTPPTKKLQMLYGAFVGFLFAPQVHIASLYFTPELALITGNVLSYFISPKEKLVLKLKEKIQLSPDTYEFVFTANQHFSFSPGQYLEWTMGHTHPDSRGNRRYFTIASSPNDRDISMGVKMYPQPSTFKQARQSMEKGATIVASQLAGDFTLPADRNKKLVFIAGGVGITPFTSMIKYLLATKQKRDIVLFFANKNSEDIVYKELFTQAEKELGIRTIYTISSHDAQIAKNMKIGRVSEHMIKEEVPDYQERMFYLSGPRSMVSSFEEVLSKMGIRKNHIITDFFPGFA